MYLRTIAVKSDGTVSYGIGICVLAQVATKTEVKGMITTRTGETLIVKSADGSITVALTDDTRTKDDRGLFGLEKQQMSNVVLIPGLKVDIDGSVDDQRQGCSENHHRRWRRSGGGRNDRGWLHPTAQQVAANVQALEAHSEQLAAHHVQLAAQKGKYGDQPAE